jgi:hypothetical protein
MKWRSFLLWAISFLFTVSLAVYQRLTGPTHPVRGKVVLAGETIKYKLVRSWDEGDARISIRALDRSVGGTIRIKRIKDPDSEWHTMPLQRMGDNLEWDLPHQPPAGKLMYQISLHSGNESLSLTDEPVVIRFKGVVPMWVLIPHIFVMFLAMMISTRTGLEAVFHGRNRFIFAYITTASLFVGGLILGPLVQKFAFGAYWTGWPFGQDLTDNKTLVAFIFWAIALWRLYKNPGARTWPIVAALALVVIFIIPHSMLGSELDYATGEITTGNP